MTRSLRGVIVSGGIVVLASVLAGGSSGCPPPTSTQTPTPTPTGPLPGGDDDRPPIIVSSGSVHLRIVAKDRGKGNNIQRGTWQKDSAANVWYHDHGGPPADHLIVNVFYGSGASGSNCDNPEWDFDVRELNIGYGPISASSSFRVFIDPPGTNPPPTKPGRLATNANGSADQKAPNWLNVGIPLIDHLVSVTFPPATAGGPSTVCALDAIKGQVHIYQSTKH